MRRAQLAQVRGNAELGTPANQIFRRASPFVFYRICAKPAFYSPDHRLFFKHVVAVAGFANNFSEAIEIEAPDVAGRLVAYYGIRTIFP